MVSVVKKDTGSFLYMRVMKHNCPVCGKQMKVFGESHVEEVAAKYDLKVLGRIPLNPELAALCDAGRIEDFEGDYLIDAAKEVAALPIKEKK